jgi:D-glycero-D-manno-heptose 1,7-bisphosphate phosphatase
MRLSNSSVVVLDRDGVINEDSPDFIKTPAEWHAIPGSLEAIARLHQAGITVVVATNQSGVGRGLFTIDTLWDIHRKMLAEVSQAGGYIARIFFCLHGPDDNCDCRKPKPGLLYQAAEYLACGLQNMIVIGDSVRDLESAVAVGARPVLVRTGKGRAAEKLLMDHADFDNLEVFDDLASAVDKLMSELTE